jgi:glutathione S-transferase
MRLFYSAGASSLAPHIVLRELGLPFTLERVDRATGRTASGEHYLSINPKGYVPALQLDDGQVLTEGMAITQYLADRYAPGTIAPLSGTVERAGTNACLSFIGTEMHKPFDTLFDADAAPSAIEAAKRKLYRWFGLLDHELADGRAYLGGKDFTLPDAYLFVVQTWAPLTGLDLTSFPHLLAHGREVAVRPAVIAALQAERLGEV